ncbi:MAG TPA: hypothetical protein VGN04_07845 [Herbaspirillum sp.]|jgi:hypothetical protein
MYRIAKQSLFLPVEEQLCQTRPLLVLQQRPVSQVNVVLPDRIRFFYPDANGRHAPHELEVHVLGENAHGVCFLTGICHSANSMETARPPAMEAFRMNLICGMITRLQTGERMSLQDWERRVRRCFAMDCKADALPLSSMLISTASERIDMSD